jgi:hypothetical protein
MLRRVALLRVLIAALFAVLAFSASPASAATATAQQFAGDSAAWKKAYDTAVAYWGQTPCAGDVEAQWKGLDARPQRPRVLDGLPERRARARSRTATSPSTPTRLGLRDLLLGHGPRGRAPARPRPQRRARAHHVPRHHDDGPGVQTRAGAAGRVDAPSTTRTTAQAPLTRCTRARIAKLRRAGKLARSSCKRSAAGAAA